MKRIERRFSEKPVKANEHCVLPSVSWRFLTQTIWVSLTSGFFIYIPTLLLNIPYGWAAFILVFRAFFWACVIDIRRLNVTFRNSQISGPHGLFTASPQSVDITKILIDQKFEQHFGMLFSILDQEGNAVMGHYAWYSPADRQVLKNLVRGLKEAAQKSKVACFCSQMTLKSNRPTCDQTGRASLRL